jgi:hypothetical protein
MKAQTLGTVHLRATLTILVAALETVNGWW